MVTLTRVLIVWDFLIGIVARKAELYVKGVLSTQSCQYLFN